jgi:predicted porin
VRKYVLTTAAFVGAFGLASAAYAADDDGSATVNGITIYGTIDEAVTYLTHGSPGSAYVGNGIQYLVSKINSAARFSVGPNALSQSIIGIKGATDLGGGFTGLFVADTGFEPQSGNLTDGLKSLELQNGIAVNRQTASGDSSRNGQALNGQAYVGISNDNYGTLTLGRQNALETNGVIKYDPQGTSNAFAIIGFSGATSGSGRTEDARWDDSIKYAYNFGPVRTAVMYQTPGDIGGAGNDFGYAGNIGVDYGGLSVDAIYTVKHDATGAAPLSAAQVATAPLASLSITVSDDTSYSLLAKYSVDRLTLYGGFEYIIFANPSNPLAVGDQLQGGYLIGAVNDTNFLHHEDLKVAWTGFKYAATDRLDITAAYYGLFQNSFAPTFGANKAFAGCTSSVNSFCSGTEYAFSLVFDYKLSKRFDAYAGAMYSQVTGGLRNGFLFNNTIDPTLGMRFKF